NMLSPACSSRRSSDLFRVGFGLGDVVAVGNSVKIITQTQLAENEVGILGGRADRQFQALCTQSVQRLFDLIRQIGGGHGREQLRSEEHTSELQSRFEH